MNKKELTHKYAELLMAKQRAILNPEGKGLEWKYNRLDMLYQDALLKSKLSVEELANVEIERKDLFEKNRYDANHYKETYKQKVLNTLDETKQEKALEREIKGVVFQRYNGRENQNLHVSVIRLK